MHGTLTVARGAVAALVAVVALLGAGLVALSVVPPAVLAQRVLSSTGEARSGAVFQTLVLQLPDRLRLAGAGLLALAVGLLVLRQPLQTVLSTAWRDVRCARLDLTWLRQDGPALGVLTLVGLAIRLVYVRQPMRYDEALSFNEFASRPLYYALSYYPEPNNHLLNTLLTHVAWQVLGSQPWVLRLPALLAGVLLVPATYALGRQLYGRSTGLVGAALVAASSYLIEYSTNGRGYTLAALAFVVCFSLSIAGARWRSTTALLLAVIVAALGFYALPTMVYGVAVIVCWLAVSDFVVNRQHLVLGLLLVLLVALLYLPVVVVSGADALVANRFVVSLSYPEWAQQLPSSLARTWALWQRDVPLVGTLVLVLGFGVATVDDLRQGRAPVGLLAVGVCVLLAALQRVAPFERVWLFLMPLWFVVAASGLVRLGRRLQSEQLVVATLLIAVLGLAALSATSGSVLRSDETGVFPDAERVTAVLADRLVAEDAVVTQVPASLPELQYYFPRAGLSITALVRDPSDARRVFVIASRGSSVPTGAHVVEEFPSAIVYELER